MITKMVPKYILERKPARRMSEIPLEVLKYLNRGEVESKNLVEFLAVDQKVLLKHQLPLLGLDDFLPSLINAWKQKASLSVMQQFKFIAQNLLEQGITLKQTEKLSAHVSDFCRNYAAYILCMQKEASFTQKMTWLAPLADDPNSGVREIAWMALRPYITENLSKNIQQLSSWCQSDRANLRRLASEVSRPRGVWCAHIQELKDKPEQALLILDPLKQDEALYVQNSVANWLNDASKTQSDFVKKTCQRWLKETKNHLNTQKIVKRALRTLNKPKS